MNLAFMNLVLDKCEFPEDAKVYFRDLADSYIDSRYNIALEAHSETLNVTETPKLADYSVFNLKMSSED